MLSHGITRRRQSSRCRGSRTLHRPPSPLSIHFDGLFTLSLFILYVHLQNAMPPFDICCGELAQPLYRRVRRRGHRAHPHAASRGGVRRADRTDETRATRPRVVPAAPPARPRPPNQHDRERQHQMSRRPLSSQPVVSVALSLSHSPPSALNALLLALLSRSA